VNEHNRAMEQGDLNQAVDRIKQRVLAVHPSRNSDAQRHQDSGIIHGNIVFHIAKRGSAPGPSLWAYAACNVRRSRGDDNTASLDPERRRHRHYAGYSAA
jgi:hypothetical protein